MNEQAMHQEVRQPTMEELILGLILEMQHLRMSIHALNEAVEGLNNALREE